VKFLDKKANSDPSCPEAPVTTIFFILLKKNNRFR
jgi:hypothetical protein